MWVRERGRRAWDEVNEDMDGVKERAQSETPGMRRVEKGEVVDGMDV